MKSDLPLAADDGWDMSPRRETAVMVDMPTAFEPLSPERPLPSARGVLSSAEIEALLRPDLSDLPAAPAEPEVIAEKPLPDVEAPLAPVEASGPSTDIPDTARRLASRLSLALRKGCGLRAAAVARAVEEGDFDTGLRTGIAGQGSAIACFAAEDGEINAMLIMSPELANALIETACGGSTSGELDTAWTPRDLTPLDSALLEGLVRPLGHAIAPGLSFAGVETEADFAVALARPGAAEIVDFVVRVESGRHAARLILAKDLAEAHVPQALPAPAAEGPPAKAASSLTVVLTARVATLSVPLSRLSDLTAGSTLLLGVPADQPVELLSGGRDGPVVAEAQIGRKGNRMALRISRRVPGTV